ncbi:MAG: hypothetical protein WBB43_13675 [Limnoraphis sp.]
MTLLKELLNSKLTHLLKAFKTDEISLEEITQEVEAVRTEIYEQQTAH